MVDFGLYCLSRLGSTPNFLGMYCDFPVIRLVNFVQAARLCAERSKGLIKNLKKYRLSTNPCNSIRVSLFV